MSEHNISIKGGKTIRLKTAGKYCDRDIVVNAPDDLDALINNTITEVSSDAKNVLDYKFQNCSALTRASFPNAIAIGKYAFSGCSNLAEANIPNTQGLDSYAFKGCSSLGVADFPKVKTPGSYSFDGCTNLHTANFPAATTISVYCFQNCTSLVRVKFPNATSVGSSSFQNCAGLRIADFTKIASIGASAFKNSAIEALVIRNDTAVCKLSATSAFSGTPIEAGTGYIYVIREGLDAYKASTNWMAFADRFRALEDYTVDGTVTGELDESKMFGGDPIV